MHSADISCVSTLPRLCSCIGGYDSNYANYLLQFHLAFITRKIYDRGQTNANQHERCRRRCVIAHMAVELTPSKKLLLQSNIVCMCVCMCVCVCSCGRGEEIKPH